MGWGTKAVRENEKKITNQKKKLKKKKKYKKSGTLICAKRPDRL